MKPEQTLQAFDVSKIRRDFPILSREVHPGVQLVYLDSTATSQKPAAVIDAMDRYYLTTNANIHRGVHRLSQLATEAYEGSRERVRRFVNAKAASVSARVPAAQGAAARWILAGMDPLRRVG